MIPGGGTDATVKGVSKAEAVSMVLLLTCSTEYIPLTTTRYFFLRVAMLESETPPRVNPSSGDRCNFNSWTGGNQHGLHGEGLDSRRIPILVLPVESPVDGAGPFSMRDRVCIVMLSRFDWATVVQRAAPAADQEEKTCQVCVAAAN